MIRLTKRCTFWRSADAGATFAQLSGNGWFAGTDPDEPTSGRANDGAPADPDRIMPY